MGLLRSAGGVLFIIRDGAPLFVLLRHREGYWSLPKGRLEAGETGLMAARREIREETGINRFTLLRPHYWDIVYIVGGHDKKVRYYLVQALEESFKVSDEHAELKLCTYDEALRLIGFDDLKSVLKKAYEIVQGLLN